MLFGSRHDSRALSLPWASVSPCVQKRLHCTTDFKLVSGCSEGCMGVAPGHPSAAMCFIY